MEAELTFDPPRSAWGKGPWTSEGDRVRFDYAGFPCLALRNRFGAWCGYVAVPPGHPAHGKGYNDVDVDAHGGLSYAGACFGAICHVPKPGEPDDVWWLGFDCAHAGDLAPGMEAVLRQLGRQRGLRSLRMEVYRDLAYVKREIRSLARQLREAVCKTKTTTIAE